MELSTLSKSQLLTKCEELGIKNCKSKNKCKIIELILSEFQKPVIEKIDVENNHENMDIDVQNMCGLEYLKTIDNNSIDLILTDPPYIISKNSGMNDHYNNVKFNEENDIDQVKTEEEWEEYKIQNNICDDINKDKF